MSSENITQLFNQVVQAIQNAISKLTKDSYGKAIFELSTPVFNSNSKKFPIWSLHYVPISDWWPDYSTSEKNYRKVRLIWANNFRALLKNPKDFTEVPIVKETDNSMFSYVLRLEPVADDFIEPLVREIEQFGETKSLRSEIAEAISSAKTLYRENRDLLEAKYPVEKRGIEFHQSLEAINLTYDKTISELEAKDNDAFLRNKAASFFGQIIKSHKRIPKSIRVTKSWSVVVPFSNSVIKELTEKEWTKYIYIFSGFCRAYISRFGSIDERAFQIFSGEMYISPEGKSLVTSQLLSTLKKRTKKEGKLIPLFHALRYYYISKKEKVYSLKPIKRKDDASQDDTPPEGSIEDSNPYALLSEDNNSNIETIKESPKVTLIKVKSKGSLKKRHSEPSKKTIPKVQPSLVDSTTSTQSYSSVVSGGQNLPLDVKPDSTPKKEDQVIHRIPSVKATKKPSDYVDSSTKPKDIHGFTLVNPKRSKGKKKTSKLSRQEEFDKKKKDEKILVDSKVERMPSIKKAPLPPPPPKEEKDEDSNAGSTNSPSKDISSDKAEDDIQPSDFFEKSSDESSVEDIRTWDLKQFLGKKIEFRPSKSDKNLRVSIVESTVYVRNDVDISFLCIFNGKAIKDVKELENILFSNKKDSKEVNKPVTPNIHVREKGTSRKDYYKMPDETLANFLQVLPEEYLRETKSGMTLKPLVYTMYTLYSVEDILKLVASKPFEDVNSLVTKEYNQKARASREKVNFSQVWADVKVQYKGITLCSNPSSKKEKDFLAAYKDLQSQIKAAKGPKNVLPLLKKKGSVSRTSQKSKGKGTGQSLIDPNLLATLQVLKEFKKALE